MAFDKDEDGFITGSLKSQAAAMYKAGATRLEVLTALGNPCLNVLTELEGMGYKVLRKKVKVGRNKPHFRYTVIKDE